MFQRGDSISILLGSATCPTAVGIRMFHARVEQVTARGGLQLVGEAGTVWLPAAALIAQRGVVNRDEVVSYKLAGWFRPDARQVAVFDRCEGAFVSDTRDHRVSRSVREEMDRGEWLSECFAS